MVEMRIARYIHSDSVTAHKGAALALVEGRGSTSEGAAAFVAQAARMAYATGATAWGDVATAFPEVEQARLASHLRVASVAVLCLAPGQAGRVDIASDDTRTAAALVKIACTTDFGARTSDFVAFAGAAAAAVVHHRSRHWGTLAALEPGLEARRKAVAASLREDVVFVEALILAPCP